MVGSVPGQDNETALGKPGLDAWGRALQRRSCSPGTTGTVGICPGGRGPGRGPTPIASGSARSCCSRPPSPPRRDISRVSSPAGQPSRRSPRRSSTRCCTPGRGSATMQGRATCTNARCWSSPNTAAASPTASRVCARSPGSAPTPRRRSRRSLSTARPRRSTAMSNASSRGCSRSRIRCRAPRPRSTGLPPASHRVCARAITPRR